MANFDIGRKKPILSNKEIAHLVSQWADWLIRDQASNPLGYPSRSTEGRMMEEGGRVDGRPAGPIIPLRQMPAILGLVNTAIKTMPSELYGPMQCKHFNNHKDAILVYCKENAISVRTYYYRIEDAYRHIADRMAHIT